MGYCLSIHSKIEGSPVNTDHFGIERVVGVGGFGKVNCVTKLYGADSKTHYAMKTLWKKEAFKTKSSEDMLFNEREILEKLHHPRLVNMLYAFQDPYRCYLVLDLALGEIWHTSSDSSPVGFSRKTKPFSTLDSCLKL